MWLDGEIQVALSSVANWAEQKDGTVIQPTVKIVSGTVSAQPVTSRVIYVTMSAMGIGQQSKSAVALPETISIKISSSTYDDLASQALTVIRIIMKYVTSTKFTAVINMKPKSGLKHQIMIYVSKVKQIGVL